MSPRALCSTRGKRDTCSKVLSNIQPLVPIVKNMQNRNRLVISDSAAIVLQNQESVGWNKNGLVITDRLASIPPMNGHGS
jgi:hypothetical protein